MKFISTLYTLIFILAFVPTKTSAQQLTAIKSFEAEFDPEFRVGYISSVLRIGGGYIVLDLMLRKVYLTNRNFKVTHVFNPESCHPGTIFNPMRLTQISESKVLISSDPIRAYIFDVISKKCSTREFATEKFMGHGDMTRADDGLLGITHQKSDNTIKVRKYNNSLKTVLAFSIKDDLPFINLRVGLTEGNRLLYHNNKLLYLNPYDISIMFLDLSSNTNQIKRIVKPIPIQGLTKVRSDMSRSAREEMNLSSMLAPIKGKHVAGSMAFLGSERLLIKVSQAGSGGTGSEYYACDIDLDKCDKIKISGSGGLFYADRQELIFMLASDENPIIHRYDIR